MKKIISILICIQIALFPAFAFAANVGGWSMGNPVAQGASTVYNGTKNVIINGADYIKKGTAKITPTASQVAKVLRGGAAGYALSIAVEQLLGSVDWVLDPANNQIKYKVPGETSQTCTYSGMSCNDYCAAQAAATYRTDGGAVQYEDSYYGKRWYCQTTSGFKYAVLVGAQTGTSTTEEEEKSIPLDVVAQKVISNAESGDTNAQAATTAAAADIVDEASKDDAKARPIAQQLESTAKTTPADQAAADSAGTGTGTQTKDPANPDITNLTLEFPVFCNWAPTVCEAAQVVISFPQTLTNWWNTATTSIAEAWTAVKEWATAEPDLKEDPTDLPLEDTSPDRDPSSFDTDYIVLGAQCPTFEPYTVSVGPVSETLSFDLMPLCQFAEKVRPAILGMSYLTAAGIVIAAIRET